jgi:hypothetical protein
MQPNAFKTLQVIHVALLMGMSVFVLISLYVHMNNREMERSLQVGCVIASLISIVAGFNIFKRKIMLARHSDGPGVERMNKYRSACIIWWAMIEWPGLLTTTSFILTGNYAFFALAVFHIIILLVFMPRKDNIVVLLNLTSKEVDQLEGKA